MLPLQASHTPPQRDQWEKTAQVQTSGSIQVQETKFGPIRILIAGRGHQICRKVLETFTPQDVRDLVILKPTGFKQKQKMTMLLVGLLLGGGETLSPC